MKGVPLHSENISGASMVDAAAPAGAALPSPSSALALWAASQEQAHCLVIDAARFPEGGDDMQQLQAVLATDVSSEVLPLLLRWLPALDACDVACAYVEVRGATRLLHINLRTRDGLAAALRAVPSLVRCGTLPVQSSSHAWSGPRCKACGPARHQLPEMLQLTCTPASPKAHEHLQRDVTELLASVQLQDSTWWFPSSHEPRRTGVAHLTINVVPRAASEAEVGAAIARIHDKARLWGGLVRAHAPNSPSLSRCRDCDALGHATGACPRFQGIAVRLLFSSPLPYASMLELSTLLGARDGFLGQGGDKMPHRKVTLLFPQQEEQQLAARLLDISLSLAHLLHVPPYVVDVAQRQRECRECGYFCASATGARVPVARCRGTAAPAHREAVAAAQGRTTAPAQPRCFSTTTRRCCFCAACSRGPHAPVHKRLCLRLCCTAWGRHVQQLAQEQDLSTQGQREAALCVQAPCRLLGARSALLRLRQGTLRVRRCVQVPASVGGSACSQRCCRCTAGSCTLFCFSGRIGVPACRCCPCCCRSDGDGAGSVVGHCRHAAACLTGATVGCCCRTLTRICASRAGARDSAPVPS